MSPFIRLHSSNPTGSLVGLVDISHLPEAQAGSRSLLFYDTLLLILSAVPAEVLHAMASASLSRKGKTLLC